MKGIMKIDHDDICSSVFVYNHVCAGIAAAQQLMSPPFDQEGVRKHENFNLRTYKPFTAGVSDWGRIEFGHGQFSIGEQAVGCTSGGKGKLVTPREVDLKTLAILANVLT